MSEAPRSPRLDGRVQESRERDHQRRAAQRAQSQAQGGLFDPCASRKRHNIAGAEVSLFWDGARLRDLNNDSSHEQMRVCRTRRRVYVGNLPRSDLSAEQLKESFDKEMRARKLLQHEELDPILLAWLPDNATEMYGFVEFTNERDAKKSLLLEGMLILGQPITVRRPQDWVAKPGDSPEPTLDQADGVGEGLSVSRFLRIHQALIVDSSTVDAHFDTVLGQLQGGTSTYQGVVRSGIVRPEHVAMLDDALEPGDAILEFTTADAAQLCVQVFASTAYDGRKLRVTPVSEASFDTCVGRIQPPAVAH